MVLKKCMLLISISDLLCSLPDKRMLEQSRTMHIARHNDCDMLFALYKWIDCQYSTTGARFARSLCGQGSSQGLFAGAEAMRVMALDACGSYCICGA